MSDPKTGWFYVVTEEAAPILKKVFDVGVHPGRVIILPPEDFEILSAGMRAYPVAVRDEEPSGIIVPQAS